MRDWALTAACLWLAFVAVGYLFGWVTFRLPLIFKTPLWWQCITGTGHWYVYHDIRLLNNEIPTKAVPVTLRYCIWCGSCKVVSSPKIETVES